MKPEKSCNFLVKLLHFSYAQGLSISQRGWFGKPPLKFVSLLGIHLQKISHPRSSTEKRVVLGFRCFL